MELALGRERRQGGQVSRAALCLQSGVRDEDLTGTCAGTSTEGGGAVDAGGSSRTCARVSQRGEGSGLRAQGDRQRPGTTGRPTVLEAIFTPGTKFGDWDTGLGQKLGGGQAQPGTFPEPLGWDRRPAGTEVELSPSLGGPTQGRLEVELEPGEVMTGVDIAVGDAHPDKLTNKDGGWGTPGWARLSMGIKRSGVVQWFMKEQGVPPEGVLSGGPVAVNEVVKKGDTLVVEAQQYGLCDGPAHWPERTEVGAVSHTTSPPPSGWPRASGRPSRSPSPELRVTKVATGVASPALSAARLARRRWRPKAKAAIAGEFGTALKSSKLTARCFGEQHRHGDPAVEPSARHSQIAGAVASTAGSAQKAPPWRGPTHLPIDNLDDLGASAAGDVFSLDETTVSCMEVRVRQIVDAAREATQFDLRLTPDAAKDLKLRLTRALSKALPGATVTQAPYVVDQGSYSWFHQAIVFSRKEALPAQQRLCTAGWKRPRSTSWSSSPIALKPIAARCACGCSGPMTRSENGTSKKPSRSRASRLPWPMRTCYQSKRFLRLSLLRMVAPGKAEAFSESLATTSLKDLDEALGPAGVTQQRIAQAWLKEVFPGELGDRRPRAREGLRQGRRQRHHGRCT